MVHAPSGLEEGAPMDTPTGMSESMQAMAETLRLLRIDAVKARECANRAVERAKLVREAASKKRERHRELRIKQSGLTHRPGTC
jgi:hypothetical protein